MGYEQQSSTTLSVASWLYIRADEERTSDRTTGQAVDGSSDAWQQEGNA